MKENRALITNISELCQESNIHLSLKEEFQQLVRESEEYAKEGYMLLSIDGILLNMCK